MPLLCTQTASRPLRYLLYRGLDAPQRHVHMNLKHCDFEGFYQHQLVGNHKEPREGARGGCYLINVCSCGKVNVYLVLRIKM